jgi:hypothetical protein
MALKPFAFILCLPVAEHHVANRYNIIYFIMRKRQSGTRLGKTDTQGDTQTEGEARETAGETLRKRQGEIG